MSFSKEETDVEWVGSSIDARRIRSASKYQTHQSHFHCQMPSCPTTFPQQVSHTGKNILEAWKIIEKYWSRKSVDRLIMVNICKSMKGLASYCRAETAFTFYFSILTLSSAFLSINNIEMKSESGFSFAMASQPFRFGSYIFNKIFFKYAEILNIQICCLLLDQIFQ